jgi:hypothetical protein
MTSSPNSDVSPIRPEASDYRLVPTTGYQILGFNRTSCGNVAP